MTPEKFEAAIARLSQWLLGLAVAGAMIAGSFFGLPAAGGFLIGALAAWFNLKLIERAVDRLARQVMENPAKKRRAGVLLKFGALVLAAFVMISYSGFSMVAALLGFLVCPAAVILEMLYELVNHDA